MFNQGVKALLRWVSVGHSDELTVKDLQDGRVLLKLINMIGKEPVSSLSESSEDRFRLISEFLESECRFCPTEDTKISMDNIRDDDNPTFELAKVLLLLVNYDMMNKRCTLHMLGNEVESVLEYLTSCFIIEKEGSVYLSDRLDSYLARKYIPASYKLFNDSATTSSTSSTLFSDEDSPDFQRKRKISFIDMETVASSSVSKSPLAEIMNTPKFQMTKMKLQLVKEREYRDGLTKDLDDKLSLIALRESQISQLQYRLDKLKEEKSEEEVAIRKQINELETKNDILQTRLNEMLKENKELKLTSSQTERQVDELMEEKGSLSSQMRAVCSQLALFKEEVNRLTASQASANEEWEAKTKQLESELNQVTAQKEYLSEQIEILQGKMTCLEEELRRVDEEVDGENMGPVMEICQREDLETEIQHLKNELESSLSSLQKAEAEIHSKNLKMVEYQHEVLHHKELLEQHKDHTDKLIQANEETMEQLKREMTGQSEALHKQIQELELRLELVERQKAEQLNRLQQDIVTLEHEIETLKEKQKEKDDLLHQTEDSVKDLEGKLTTASSLLSEKEQNIKNLSGKIEHLTDEKRRSDEAIQLREEAYTKLLQEKSEEQDGLSNQIQALTARLEELGSSLRQAEQEVQIKKEAMDLLRNQSSEQAELLHQEIHHLKQQVESCSSSLKQAEASLQTKEKMFTEEKLETAKHLEEFQVQIMASQDEVRRLEAEVEAKEEQLFQLKVETTSQTELLHKEVEALNEQMQTVNSSLKVAEEALKAKEDLMAKQEEENSLQIQELKHKCSALEEEVDRCRRDIQTKQEEVEMLKAESSKEKEVLLSEVHVLQMEVQGLTQTQENLLAQKELELSRIKENFEEKVKSSEDEFQRLVEVMAVKEEQLITLKKEEEARAELLQQEITFLKSRCDSLAKAEAEVQTLLVEVTKEQQEHADQVKILQQQLSASEQALKGKTLEMQTKEEEMRQLKNLNSEQAELQLQEIRSLQEQVEGLRSSLETAEESLKSKEDALKEQKECSTLKMEEHQEEVRRLTVEVMEKEEQLTQLKTKTAAHTDSLQQEIEVLKAHMNTMSNSLQMAEEQVKAKDVLMAKQEDDYKIKIEELNKNCAGLEEEVKELKGCIQTRQAEVERFKVENSKMSESLNSELQTLREQKQKLSDMLEAAEEQVQRKEKLLAQKEMELSQKEETFQETMANSKGEIRRLLEQIKENEEQMVILKEEETKHSDTLQQEIRSLKIQMNDAGSSLRKAEEQIQTQQAKLTRQEQDKNHQVELLQELLSAAKQEVSDIRNELQAKENQMLLLKTENSEQTSVLHQQNETLQLQIQSLKGEVAAMSKQLQAKEEKLHETQQESLQQMNLLQQQLVCTNAELTQHKETLAANLRMIEHLQELQVSSLKEKEVFIQEKEALMAHILQAETDQKALEKQVQTLVLEKQRLAQTNQAIERENVASRRLESLQQQEIQILKTEREKLLREREQMEESEKIKRDLQEQLTAKAEAAEHFKAQMERAVSHYNGKKQLLQKNEEEKMELKHSLEVKEQEVKAMQMERKLLQMDLDKAQSNEKKLKSTVASLEAQLAIADQNLRTQNKIHGGRTFVSESCLSEVSGTRSGFCPKARVKKSISSDSLEQSSLEDSLNSTRKPSIDSSTPLVRTSERLAAKHRNPHTESLETLYFTPINVRQTKRTGAEFDEELDSARKNPTSSVKRRRTTQKTPGYKEEEETFCSLPSARSQPNLACAPSGSDAPVGQTGAASDQLIGLPGYRRSTIHAHTASTFCVGAENEPDGGHDDWVRIAELQTRNKACLPHLKSSYPIESETGCSGGLVFTDQDLRLGDPSETIRRVSMMPGQLQDSLVSHRQSLMLGQVGAAAGTRSHRLSLMPGHLTSKNVNCAQMKSPKNSRQSSSSLSAHLTSPERKGRASCFPRPLTPKNKNILSGPQPALSPADRRQSMMFTIDNTPKKNSYLKKGLTKLRNSTRKSPATVSRTKVTKGPENTPQRKQSVAEARASKAGGFKTPQAKGKPAQAPGRSAKSPGLTASARKMMRRMKV